MSTKKELWTLFTAEKEYRSTITDKYNRHPYWASKNRTVLTPVVSEYLVKSGLKPNYPGNRKFAICLTHDIDFLYNNFTPRQLLRKGIKNLATLNPAGLSRTIKTSIKQEINPAFRISETLKYEKKYDARSSFYFLSLSPEEEDFNYHLSDIPHVFEEVLDNHGEIGLHGGHQAFNSVSKMKQEKEKLEAVIGRKVTGYRNHYLRFKTPSTWEYLDEADFKYDTTYGYADCVGFRNGMCHPFQPYNVDKNAYLDLMELPLILMEATLWDYMRLKEEDQFSMCKNLMDTVAANHGVLTLVWHNNQMQGYKGQLYDAILKYANEQGAWMTTGNEIVDFWKENKLHETTNNLLEELKNG